MQFINREESIDMDTFRSELRDGTLTEETVIFSHTLHLINLALALLSGFGGLGPKTGTEGYRLASLTKMPMPTLSAFMQTLFALRLLMPDTERVSTIMLENHDGEGDPLDPIIALRLNDLPDLRGEGNTQEMVDEFLSTLQKEANEEAIKEHNEMMERMTEMLGDDMQQMEEAETIEEDGVVYKVPKKGMDA